jgi:hypothetical protein
MNRRYLKLLSSVLAILIASLSVLKSDPPKLGPSRLALVDSTILLKISGDLQEGDAQYVHDIFCMETGRLIGTVRMRWAHKYGHRYGGVGTEVQGDLEYLARLPDGRVRLRLLNPNVGASVLVVDRLVKIPD